MSERLHKLLAQHGLGSRREIERWILEGRVRLNGQPAQAGAQFTPGDRVSIDGNDVTARLRSEAAAQVIMYHKPQHQPVTPGTDVRDVAAADDEALKQSVMERLPAQRGVRWLAINTMQSGDSGLLLLTTDGHLADALRRRAETIPAAYVARVLVPTPDFDVAEFPLTVRYDEGAVEFVSIEAAGGEGANRWFLVQAGHSHRRAAVRALFESRGLGVSRVAQVRFATFVLPRDLPRGRHRALTDSQLRELYALAGLSMPKTRVELRDERREAPRKATPQSGKAKAKRVSVDRSGGRAGRRPGGKLPQRVRTKPGQAPEKKVTGSRKSDR
jgi:23S rRNA pseudouridine2605 synthase